MPLILEDIKQCAREVYGELGSGHSEAVYETAMAVEIGLRDLPGPVLRQVPCPIKYKGFTVGVGYIDILLDDVLIVELKAVAKLTSRDETQVRKYLSGTGLRLGLLINFGSELEMTEVHSIDCYINDHPSFADHGCGLLGIPDELPPSDEEEEDVDHFVQRILDCMKYSIEERRLDGETPRTKS